MRVKLKKIICGSNGTYWPDHIIDVDNDVAKIWIDTGVAVLVKNEAKRTKKRGG